MKLKVIYKNGVPFAVHNEKEYRFELEKDDWQSEIKKVFPRLYNSGMDKDFIRHTEDGFMEGYKAAQSKGCFTEEDMKSFSKFVTSNLMKHSDENGVYLGIDKVFSMWNQPKKLVAIEVEHEMIGHPHKWVDTPILNKSGEHPDGLLTIKQYYYE